MKKSSKGESLSRRKQYFIPRVALFCSIYIRFLFFSRMFLRKKRKKYKTNKRTMLQPFLCMGDAPPPTEGGRRDPAEKGQLFYKNKKEKWSGGLFRDYSEVPQWQLLPSHRALKQKRGSGGLRDCRIYHCSGKNIVRVRPGTHTHTSVCVRSPSAYSRNQRFTVPRRLKRLRGSKK
jgi:hypothetical protein